MAFKLLTPAFAFLLFLLHYLRHTKFRGRETDRLPWMEVDVEREHSNAADLQADDYVAELQLCEQNMALEFLCQLMTVDLYGSKE